MEGVFVPIVVFLAVYVALTFELVNKAVAALLGVMILLVLHVVSEHQAVEFIDLETIMLLLGMMSIVAILRKSGFFSIVSVRIAELTQGSPLKILILFSIVTAVLSAFLDNVTTVLIIIPIIIELTAGMGLDPKMYVISQAIISNIGGTATLIGDPPNIIIGSKVGLTFNQFMLNLTLPVLVCFAAALVYIWATNREKFKPIDTNLAKLFSVQLLLESNPIPNNILWWALSLGACLGGNLTMIGASANIVSMGMAKKFGQEISFLDFARKSVVITLITLVIASGYLMLYLWISL